MLTNLIKKQKPKREPRYETEPSGHLFPRYLVFPNQNLTFQKQKIESNVKTSFKVWCLLVLEELGTFEGKVLFLHWQRIKQKKTGNFPHSSLQTFSCDFLEEFYV